VYSEKTPDDGQRNCPKHVEFYCENKFEKLVHLVGFIIRTFLFFIQCAEIHAARLQTKFDCTHLTESIGGLPHSQWTAALPMLMLDSSKSIKIISTNYFYKSNVILHQSTRE